jgi:hypothetical protein
MYSHSSFVMISIMWYNIRTFAPVPKMENLVASADTADELTIFNDLEKETLTLDRSVLQQSETMESKFLFY